MRVEAYAKGLESIKTELSRYSHQSVFNSAIRYFKSQGGQGGVKHMPWVVMFLLKMSLIQRSGSIQISDSDFLRIANNIFLLSDHLAKYVPGSTFLLMVRAMFGQQLWYQISPIESWRYLFLHRALFNRSYDVNNSIFLARTGISLDDYFKAAFYFLAVAGRQSNESVVNYAMTSFYSHLSPGMSDETLAAFLRLVAIPFGQLPDFMKGFLVEDANAAEFYQETPLKNKPIIVEGDGLVIFNTSLCILGLRSIVLEVLKADPKFSTRFGRDMEAYIGERLRLSALDVYDVPQLNNKIPVKIGKIADYVVSDGTEILIFESKSIIPNVLMKCAFDPDHLSLLLKDSFIKGIEQGQETASKLAMSECFSGMRARIIIVTLDDFYIYGGEYVGEYINTGLEQSYFEKYGTLPVPMSDVIYLTLKDLILVTEWLKDKPENAIFTLLDELDAKQKEAGGVRFSFSQHINEQVAGQVQGVVGVFDTVEQSQQEMSDLLNGNSRYWRGQHPVSFMRAYDRFKQRLIRSFSEP